MKNFLKTTVAKEPRVELHDKLNLTGSEISVNRLPAGTSVPFIHSHKENEEVYIILEGKGYFVIDDEKIELSKGDFIKVDPKGERQLFAAKDSGIEYVCIQTKANFLEEYTAKDALIK